MTFTIFGFGAVLIMLSLVGGNFKIFGAEVSGTAGKIGRITALVIGLFMVLLSFGLMQFDHSQHTTSTKTKPTNKAILNVAWTDGTPELQQLVLTLPEEQKLLLGYNALLTGIDYYAAKVRLNNLGNVPVNVYPQNILIHFGNESATVKTIDHWLFLQNTTLQPGNYVEGLVVYQARMDIGAAIRLGQGRLSYNDNTVQVTYN